MSLDLSAAHFAIPRNVDTPALVLDIDRLEANIHRMATEAKARRVKLRPHAKTHKSIEVATRQREAGANGLTVATIGEAEVFAEAGFDDLFIAFPVWASEPKARRLRELARKIRLSVGVDSVEGARRLAAALGGSNAGVVVELDSGDHRSGLANPASSVDIADAAAAAGLDVRGVFTHGGHSYQSSEAVVPAAAGEVSVLGAAQWALWAAGHHTQVASAGSTPTALLSARDRVTEIRPGTYVYNDRLQAVLGSCDPEDIALLVVATVVSRADGRFVLDAGAKTLSKDAPQVLDGFGALPGYPRAVIERVYDHHAVVNPCEGPLPTLGEQVSVVPNHVCPVIDLSDYVIASRSGTRIGTWSVDARGRCQ